MQTLTDAASLELSRRVGAKPRSRVLAYLDGVTSTDLTDYLAPGGIGTISTSRGSLLKEFDAGDVTLTLLNAGGEFSPEKEGSLLNGVRYHNKRVEIQAGLELPDGTTEWLPQFVGRIYRLNGDTSGAKVRVQVRGALKALQTAQIAKPTVDAEGNTTPNPLDVPAGFSTSTLTTNPADAILQIADEAGFDSDDIDMASFDAARIATAHMHLGMTFGADGSGVSAISAMREFAQACLGTLYVNEQGKLAFYVYAGQEVKTSPVVFSADANISTKGCEPVYDLEAVVNKVVIRYGPDLTLVYPGTGSTCEDANSIHDYGERLLPGGELDCAAITTEADARWLAEYILDAYKEPPLVVSCETDFDALPVQLTDTVLLTDPGWAIQSMPMEILQRDFDPSSCVCSLTLTKSNTRLLWFTLDDDGPAGELDGDAMLL